MVFGLLLSTLIQLLAKANLCVVLLNTRLLNTCMILILEPCRNEKVVYKSLQSFCIEQVNIREVKSFNLYGYVCVS